MESESRRKKGKDYASGIGFQNKILTHENQTLHIQNILAHEKNHFTSIQYQEMLHKSKQENDELRAIHRDLERRIRLMEEERYLARMKMDHLMEQNKIWIQNNGDVQRVIIRSHASDSRDDKDYGSRKKERGSKSRLNSKSGSESKRHSLASEKSFKDSSSENQERKSKKLPLNQKITNESMNTSKIIGESSLESIPSSIVERQSYRKKAHPSKTEMTSQIELSIVEDDDLDKNTNASEHTHSQNQSNRISSKQNDISSSQQEHIRNSNNTNRYDSLKASITHRKLLEKENQMLHNQIQVLQEKILLRDDEIMNLTKEYVAPNPQQLKEAEKHMEQQRAVGQLVEHIRFLQDELEKSKRKLSHYQEKESRCTCRYNHMYR